MYSLSCTPLRFLPALYKIRPRKRVWAKKKCSGSPFQGKAWPPFHHTLIIPRSLTLRTSVLHRPKSRKWQEIQREKKTPKRPSKEHGKSINGGRFTGTLLFASCYGWKKFSLFFPPFFLPVRLGPSSLNGSRSEISCHRIGLGRASERIGRLLRVRFRVLPGYRINIDFGYV